MGRAAAGSASIELSGGRSERFDGQRAGGAGSVPVRPDHRLAVAAECEKSGRSQRKGVGCRPAWFRTTVRAAGAAAAAARLVGGKPALRFGYQWRQPFQPDGPAAAAAARAARL